MERRNFLQFSFLSALTLGLKSPMRLFASASSEGVRVPAPIQPWEKVDFSYPSGQLIYPGVAVRLPSKFNTAGSDPGDIYVACRICPHQACLFNYELEYRKIGDMVGVALANPVFFCRCHMSIFDPAQKGSVIFGPASRPPWSFSIRLEKNEMVVTGIEEGAGQVG